MYAARAGKRVQVRIGILHPIAEAAELALVNLPPEAAIERVASEIVALGKQINDARLHGFIHDVVQRQPPNTEAAP